MSVPILGEAATGITVGPFREIDSSVVATVEGAPIQLAAVETNPAATTVTAAFADGASDTMTVIGGWAVLADDGSGPLPATISAFDAAGALAGSVSVSSDSAFAGPTTCAQPLSPSPLTQATGSAAAPGSGSSTTS